jgi:hypothetical protein
MWILLTGHVPVECRDDDVRRKNVPFGDWKMHKNTNNQLYKGFGLSLRKQVLRFE